MFACRSPSETNPDFQESGLPVEPFQSLNKIRKKNNPADSDFIDRFLFARAEDDNEATTENRQWSNFGFFSFAH